MRTVNTLRNRSVVLALVLLASMLAGPSSPAQQPVLPGRQPDPTTRPKVRANLEAISQRARELGLVAPNQDEDDEFIRRRMNAQLNQDFIKLHTINDETIAALSSAPSLDYKTLSEATADIKSRATRIKYNVALLQIAEKGDKVRYDETIEGLGGMIPELNRLINSFLSSPIFRLSSPNDAELRAKARCDLEGIIKLSETINKLARRMIKAPAAGK